MRLRWSEPRSRFELESTWAERRHPKRAGMWWDPKAKTWWTDRDAVASKLRDHADAEAGRRIDDADRLREAARQDSRAVDADIQIPAPKELEYMPFQRAGIHYILKRKSTLLADEMGLGKTIQSIGVLNATGWKRVLVVCPASLRLNWEIEMKKWLVNKLRIRRIEKRNDTSVGHEITIVSWDLLSRLVAGLRDGDVFDTVIADEAHYAKNPKTQRSKALKRVCQRTQRRLFLTGTPIVNRPVELHGILTALDPTMFPNFMAYAKRYCQAHYNGWGWDFSGANNLDELQGLLRERLMIRRLKRDVLTELPDKTRQVIRLTPKSRAAKKALRREAGKDVREALQRMFGAMEYEVEVGKLDSPDIKDISEAAVLRHETALAKVPDAVEFCRDLLQSERKIIVFAHHQDVVEGMRTGLAEFGAASITGSTSMTKRQAAVEAFQADSDDCRVIAGNIQAMGVGYTLTRARTVVFVELDWSPGQISQAEDRAHRKGQLDNVTVYHLVYDGSIDATLAKKVVAKQDVLERTTDRDEQTIQQARLKVPKQKTRKIPGPARVLTQDQLEAAHLAMRILAGQCDGAIDRDGVGFNGADTRFGKYLAGLSRLSQRQAISASHMALKYHRQLGSELIGRIKG